MSAAVMHPYPDTLAKARKVGASKANDVELLALYCADVLQIIVGAVSPRLVFEAAQQRGMTALDLAALTLSDPAAVSELQWDLS